MAPTSPPIATDTTSATSVADKAPAPNVEVPRQAILVIHGIGQQQPFQPLDHFGNGLRAALRREYKTVTMRHRPSSREESFDHCMRIEASGPDGVPSIRLDLYELYWAPLTQGKASFTQIIRWLAATGLTPVRRLAFNLPLLIRRAQDRADRRAASVTSPRATGSTASTAPLGMKDMVKRGLSAVGGNKTFCYCTELMLEIWRLVYVSLAAVSLAALAAVLVSRSTALVKQLPGTLGPALPQLMTWPGAATAAFAAVAAVATIGLGLSIPEQIRDLIRLRKVKPFVFDEVGQAAPQAVKANPGSVLTRVVASVKARASNILSAAEACLRWQAELRARSWFLPLSILAFALGAATTVALCLPSPPCVGTICPDLVMHNLVMRLVTADFIVVAILLGVAFVLKRVFVDYLADVALYTTADENSAFFSTRVAILKEATRRIRLLLRNREYGSVAIAGHSLGSVIAYDAINWLRTEAMLPREVPVADVIKDLVELATRTDATKAQALRDRLVAATALEPGTPAGDSARAAGRGPTQPVTAEEFENLTTFITFGSPLNKVLYFFRTRINVYETIRGHITQQLYGFRQLQNLLTQDPSIADDASPVVDQVRWVNVYSPMDPVSARLRFYSDVHEHRRWFAVWGWSHVSYWHDPKFYREVLAALQGRCAQKTS